MFADKIFREYDIRGVVGKDYDDDFAFSLGRAFAAFLKETRPDADSAQRRYSIFPFTISILMEASW
jgi:phosphomannomutase